MKVVRVSEEVQELRDFVDALRECLGQAPIYKDERANLLDEQRFHVDYQPAFAAPKSRLGGTY